MAVFMIGGVKRQLTTMLKSRGGPTIVLLALSVAVGTVSARSFQERALTSASNEQDAPVTYEEGSIANIDYEKTWYRDEAEAQSACSNDVACKGYWERNDSGGDAESVYFLLNVAGSKQFSKNVPHWTVMSVKVKKAPPPVHTAPVTYKEGSIANIDYEKTWYHTEAEAQSACSNDVACKGYWERNDSGGDATSVYFLLNVSGSKKFVKGVPFWTVISVKVKKV